MTGSLSIRIENTFAAIAPERWSRLSGTSRSGPGIYNPFLSHAYLSAMESSGSAIAETGWLGHHLFLEDEHGTLLGAIPGYLKSHSQGEYVFDHGWADAFERAGGQYYPKLQCGIPFTPATGPRLLVAQGQDEAGMRPVLAAGLRQVTHQLGVSSAHVTFLPETELPALEEAGYLRRTDQQFHFINQGYRNHDAFLDTLASRKRKALKKERRTALENGITIDWLRSDEHTSELQSLMRISYAVFCLKKQ